MVKKIYLGLTIALMLGVCSNASAQFWKSKKQKTEKTKAKESSNEKKNKEYEKLIKDAQIKKGMFNLILKSNKVYIEIPKTNFNKDFLITSRVSRTSDNKKSAPAGMLPGSPMLVNFSADTSNLYLNIPNLNNRCNENSPIYEAFKRNHINPIRLAYKIVAFNTDSTSVVFDATDIFLGNKIKELQPFGPPMSLEEIFKPSKPLVFAKNRSKLIGIKAFDKNIQINSLLTYGNDEANLTVDLCFNIVKLPENKMPIRYKDDRIGYFSSEYNEFTNQGEVKKRQFIHRWRIEPKAEDIEKYNRGELVEPAKPIIWYVDPQIPEEYREYVKKGIEDWQLAFEEIGFKNAIIAKDYPTKEENPDFDPDNIEYSCYRYIPSFVKNSMGPSWVDPRTGEIITGDVLFFSNVVKLLEEWRFVQTAQLDKRVRSSKMNKEVIGESLRLVAAHEIGHTLGLMHNLIASYNYPVDSLRSASFTKENGTTPSIMDYARYNYVAQPEDKGVYLAPPKLGVYDKFMIKIGYKYNSDVKNVDDDFTEVKKWLFEKKDQRIYSYIIEPNILFASHSNPANNKESLGDDLIKANTYGIKNLKYINKNLCKWVLGEGDNYNQLRHFHNALGKQFSTYLAHVFALVGGEYRIPTYVGYDIAGSTYVPRKKQKQAVKFILNQLKEFPNWWNTAEIEKHLGKNDYVYDLQSMILNVMFNPRIPGYLISQEVAGIKDVYTYKEYLNDIYNNVWEKSLKNRSLDLTDKMFQSMYVDKLAKTMEVKKAPAQKKLPFMLQNNLSKEQDDFFKTFLSGPIIKSVDYPVMGDMAEKTLKLLRRMKTISKAKDKEHYESLYYKLERILK
ncbi:MAG: zinc-dependent metalloprotease [Marinifilaceae bacterium]|jgi:hypothetical protein|nr:zinc-dependent metalloprotease [Marinifilaceae bacterium]